MKWDDFLLHLKEAKKQKRKDIKLDVGTLTALLFSGAMDELFDEPLSLEEYKERREEMAKALNSKAQLPKKKKTENIGLNEVSTDLKLNLWRIQANPLAGFSFVDYYSDYFKSLGYSDAQNPLIAKIKKCDGESGPEKHIVMNSYGDIAKLDKVSTLLRGPKNSGVFFYLIGQVMNRNLRSYEKNGVKTCS